MGREVKTLFGPHVAGIEEDDLVLQAKLGAEGVGTGGVFRVDVIDVYPVGKECDIRGGNAFSEGTLDHLVRDAGDASEGACEELFEAETPGRGSDRVQVEGRGRRRRRPRSPERGARRRLQWPGRRGGRRARRRMWARR